VLFGSNRAVLPLSGRGFFGLHSAESFAASASHDPTGGVYRDSGQKSLCLVRVQKSDFASSRFDSTLSPGDAESRTCGIAIDEFPFQRELQGAPEN
jgi:hypothetical protein